MLNAYELHRRWPSSVMPLLLRAVVEGVQVDIIWRRTGKALEAPRDEVRRITVGELDLTPPSNRVLCWDHTRKDYRTFKVDDIVGVGLTREVARPEPVA